MSPHRTPGAGTATGGTPKEPEAVPTESVREEYENLVDLVRKYRFAYYQEDAPLVSDAEFDDLFRRLLRRELVQHLARGVAAISQRGIQIVHFGESVLAGNLLHV